MRQLATAVDGVALEVGINGLGRGYLREDEELVDPPAGSYGFDDLEDARRVAWERQVQRVKAVKADPSAASPNRGRYLDPMIDPWKPIQWETYP